MRLTRGALDTLALLILSMLAVVTLVFGCASPADVPEPAAPATLRAADTTVGPLSAGESASVGPYEMALTAAPYADGILKPRIAIHNPNQPGASDEATLPFPAVSEFHLEDELGRRTELSSFSFVRDGPPDEPVMKRHRGIGTMMRPLQAGETVTLVLRLAVPLHKRTRLRLVSTPVPERPSTAVEFVIK